MQTIKRLWNEIYDGVIENTEPLLDSFLTDLNNIKEQEFKGVSDEADWYKDAVIYSLYVDLFAENFDGLISHLDHLEQLGVNCLWLLPILGSPMKDAGFDISDFYHIRPDLLSLTKDATETERDQAFKRFVDAAKAKGIRMLFDLPMNHVSNEHPWFLDAATGKDARYRDYFIWSDTDELYSDARIIFKGMQDSNWEWHEPTKQYYFHRFFDVQPDLNYRNPKVLVEMCNVLIHWKIRGVNGFRADAVPYLWKEVGTICENEHKTHLIVQLFRAVLDYLSPGTMLLAEACQPPKEVVNYFGGGAECNAAYHFPVMPRVYKALAAEENTAIKETLSLAVTPEIPDNSQWLMFLRVHDELTLEMVTPEERKFIHEAYCHKPEWDFRLGEGISARFAELFEFDVNRMTLANSILLTLLGTPVIYYGDEVAKENDITFFNEMVALSGYKDTRNYARGRMDWQRISDTLADETSVGAKTFQALKQMLTVRKDHPAFGRGTLEFIKAEWFGKENKNILAYKRTYQGEELLILQNLSTGPQHFLIPGGITVETDLLGQKIENNLQTIKLAPSSFYWIKK